MLDLSKVAKIEDENKQVIYVNENRQNSDLYTFATIFRKLPAKAAFAYRQEERQHDLDLLGKAAYTDFEM